MARIKGVRVKVKRKMKRQAESYLGEFNFTLTPFIPFILLLLFPVATAHAFTQVGNLEVTGELKADTITSRDGTADYITDAPADSKEYVRVNNTWQEASATGGGTWGSITGTLSDQTDLQSALDSKVESVNGHTGTAVVIGATDLADFDTEVANNSAVAANTAKVSYPGDELTADELAAVNGAAAPSASNVFATMADVGSGSGDVTKVGTPVDNQVGVWTGDGTIEGTAGLTYDGTAFDVTGNIVVSGLVDGIDIGVDVTANTAKVGLPTGTDNQFIQNVTGTWTAVDGLSGVAFSLGADLDNLLWDTGDPLVSTTATDSNHVLPASTVISSLSGKEDSLGNPSTDGMVLSSTAAGARYWITGGSGTDADAIHDNVAGEIASITNKAAPTASDLILIEDAADSNNKKYITIGALPTGSGSTKVETNTGVAPSAGDYNADTWIFDIQTGDWYYQSSTGLYTFTGTYAANPVYYTLTVTDPGNNDAITCSDSDLSAAINCGNGNTDCSATVAENADITGFTATAATGRKFDNWTDDLNGVTENPTTSTNALTMDGNKIVGASFSATTVTDNWPADPANAEYITVDTDGTSGDFSSLSAAEAAIGTTGYCENYGTVPCVITVAASTGVADTTPVTVDVSGSSTSYVYVRPATGQRHNGVFDDTVYVMDFTGDSVDGIYIQSNYFVLRGVQIIGDSGYVCVRVANFKDHITLDSNLLNGAKYGIYIDSNGSDYSGHIFSNNIIYNQSDSGIEFANNIDFTYQNYVINNTIYNVNTVDISYRSGVRCNDTASYNKITVSNNISYPNTNTSYYECPLQDHNISSDDSATGTGSLTNQTLADISFVSTSSGSENLHIQSGSTAESAGADLSSLITWDVDADSRAVPYDMGADQI